MSKEVLVWLVVAASIAVGITSSWKFGPDNVIEEASEVIIKEKTGLNVDLSPSTPEK